MIGEYLRKWGFAFDWELSKAGQVSDWASQSVGRRTTGGGTATCKEAAGTRLGWAGLLGILRVA